MEYIYTDRQLKWRKTMNYHIKYLLLFGSLLGTQARGMDLQPKTVAELTASIKAKTTNSKHGQKFGTFADVNGQRVEIKVGNVVNGFTIFEFFGRGYGFKPDPTIVGYIQVNSNPSNPNPDSSEVSIWKKSNFDEIISTYQQLWLVINKELEAMQLIETKSFGWVNSEKAEKLIQQHLEALDNYAETLRVAFASGGSNEAGGDPVNNAYLGHIHAAAGGLKNIITTAKMKFYGVITLGVCAVVGGGLYALYKWYFPSKAVENEKDEQEKLDEQEVHAA